MKPYWPAHSTYYHLMIDRFATGKNRFDLAGTPPNKQQLHGYMGGTIKGITRSLDYLQWLGINAIILTPFFQGENYHGYWTTNFEQVDPHFGTPRQLKQLIGHAHQRDMRVIMDLPFTHCHCHAPFARRAGLQRNSRYRQWFYKQGGDDFTGFFGDPRLPEFNLENPELVSYLKKIVNRWLALGFDGISFNHAKRPSSAFWRNFTGHLREKHPEVFLLGENWHESGHIGTLSPYLDGELNIPLSEALRRFAGQPGKQTLQNIFNLVDAQHSMRRQGYLLPTFLDNHDMERISYLAQNHESIIALAYLIQLTLPYPPIIYYGSERAQQQTANLSGGHYGRDRYFREPMDWQSGERMVNWVNRLTHFRNRYIDWFQSEPEIIAQAQQESFAYRYYFKGKTIYIYINHSRRQQTFSVATPIIDSIMTCDSISQHRGHHKTILRTPGYSGAIIVLRSQHSATTINLEPLAAG